MLTTRWENHESHKHFTRALHLKERREMLETLNDLSTCVLAMLLSAEHFTRNLRRQRYVFSVGEEEENKRRKVGFLNTQLSQNLTHKMCRMQMLTRSLSSYYTQNTKFAKTKTMNWTAKSRRCGSACIADQCKYFAVLGNFNCVFMWHIPPHMAWWHFLLLNGNQLRREREKSTNPAQLEFPSLNHVFIICRKRDRHFIT